MRRQWHPPFFPETIGTSTSWPPEEGRPILWSTAGVPVRAQLRLTHADRRYDSTLTNSSIGLLRNMVPRNCRLYINANAARRDTSDELVPSLLRIGPCGTATIRASRSASIFRGIRSRAYSCRTISTSACGSEIIGSIPNSRSSTMISGTRLLRRSGTFSLKVMPSIPTLAPFTGRSAAISNFTSRAQYSRPSRR